MSIQARNGALVPAPLVAGVFKLLSEPVRLRLVQALTPDGKSVSLLVEETELSQPLVSHHLRLLRDSRIARAERRGAFTFYGLADKAVWKTVQQCSDLVRRLGARRRR